MILVFASFTHLRIFHPKPGKIKIKQSHVGWKKTRDVIVKGMSTCYVRSQRIQELIETFFKYIKYEVLNGEEVKESINRVRMG